jgi:Right handed beta helix region
MYVHDNPKAFAGIYAPRDDFSGPMVVRGGRVTGSGSLGIGGGEVNRLTISGVEIDNNGGSAECAFEGGGFKGVNRGSRFTGNYVHDNNCAGVWYDINAAKNEIDHNRVTNNAGEGAGAPRQPRQAGGVEVAGLDRAGTNEGDVTVDCTSTAVSCGCRAEPVGVASPKMSFVKGVDSSPHRVRPV